MSSSSLSNQDEVLFAEDLLAEEKSVDHLKSTGHRSVDNAWEVFTNEQQPQKKIESDL